MIDRRYFLQLVSTGATSLVAGNYTFASLGDSVKVPLNLKIIEEANSLLDIWAKGMLKLQIKDIDDTLNGGLLCPACGRIHGRSIDAIYTFLNRYEQTKDKAYLNAAIDLFDWSEKNVSMPDGSYVNDKNISLWKGITVFNVITIAESLKYHGKSLPEDVKIRWEKRLEKAADYIFSIISPDFGMVNYPVTASYALALAGKYLRKPTYISKGKTLRDAVFNRFTENEVFLYGEGMPRKNKSARGTYPVDLGYNVEESLPALTLYALLMKDVDLKERVIKSLRNHLEFMLPDGAWDNSWGTRNYKWTYWGSRTSDGSLPAYGLLTDDEPLFYAAAISNLQLLRNNTVDDLLAGGPHLKNAGYASCIHHTFCHAKSLATFLNYRKIEEHNNYNFDDTLKLPREKDYGVKFIKDLNIGLISSGGWKATISSYDRGYLKPEGNASGGSLTLLYHDQMGPLLCASRNEYKLKEPNNMQMLKEDDFTLTPRAEFLENGKIYSQIYDRNATLESQSGKNSVKTFSRLVNSEQEHPQKGKVECTSIYQSNDDSFFIRVSINQQCKYILPIISLPTDIFKVKDSTVEFTNRYGSLKIIVSADEPVKIELQDTVFNFVPGFQARPIIIYGSEFDVKLKYNS